jgi:hypothetical protein
MRKKFGAAIQAGARVKASATPTSKIRVREDPERGSSAALEIESERSSSAFSSPICVFVM